MGCHDDDDEEDDSGDDDSSDEDDGGDDDSGDEDDGGDEDREEKKDYGVTSTSIRAAKVAAEAAPGPGGGEQTSSDHPKPPICWTWNASLRHRRHLCVPRQCEVVLLLFDSIALRHRHQLSVHASFLTSPLPPLTLRSVAWRVIQAASTSPHHNLTPIPCLVESRANEAKNRPAQLRCGNESYEKKAPAVASCLEAKQDRVGGR
ncbi:hypothetical protein BJ546DRAFT_691334 [Cryomyces antarcticus]